MRKEREGANSERLVKGRSVIVHAGNEGGHAEKASAYRLQYKITVILYDTSTLFGPQDCFNEPPWNLNKIEEARERHSASVALATVRCGQDQ